MKKIVHSLLALLSLAYTAGAQQYTTVKCGSEFAVALRSDSTLWGWGSNSVGQLDTATGTNPSLYYDTAIQLVPSEKWIYVGTGDFCTLAIAADSTLWGWGINLDGALGTGNNDTMSLPVQINSTSHWAAVDGGMEHTVALRSDGTLWAAGWNMFGQLGVGDTTSRDTLAQAGVDNDWKAVSAGGVHTMALKKNGTLWAWGYNFAGQLGNGTTVDAHTPVQINSDTDWVAVSAGFEFTIGLKSDGTVWSWGFNANGQLGRATTGLWDSIPQIVPGISNARSISAGADYVLVIKQNGTLWGWGFNAGGQLGITATSTELDTATQVGTDDNWVTISTAKGYTNGNAVYGSFSAGYKAAATSICTAGSNYIGQLGNGTISQSNIQDYFDCSNGQINSNAVATVVKDESLMVYPNPANDYLNISLPQSLDGQNITMTLTDASGKTITVASKIANTSDRLNVQQLASGMYFLNIADGKGNTYHAHFVKQ